MQSDVVAEGFKFNVPLQSRVVSVAKATALSDPISHFRIDGAPNVVLDTIKRAEDSDDIILRLYEAYGGHATARLITYEEKEECVSLPLFPYTNCFSALVQCP